MLKADGQTPVAGIWQMIFAVVFTKIIKLFQNKNIVFVYMFLYLQIML